MTSRFLEMRSDWHTRARCNDVQASVQRGEMTPREAAELLRSRLVPLHVALRVIAGA